MIKQTFGGIGSWFKSPVDANGDSVSVGDKFAAVDSNAAVWIVKRMCKLGDDVAPHICLAREGYPDIEKVVALETLSNMELFQPSEVH